MDEAEAETAMLVLGSQLEWLPDEHNLQAWECTNHPAYRIKSYYSLRKKEGASDIWLTFQAQFWESGKHYYGGTHATLEEAKADGEHHHETGRWISQDEPTNL